MTEKKILIIGPAWVGDMVMAQCLLRLIKQREPTAILHVLAPAWTFSLLSRMPEVTRAIEIPFGHGELKLLGRYKLGKTLQAERYDEAIVLPNSFKSALIPWFANIPKRIGWKGECRYGLLNDIRYLDKARYPLMIEQYMALGVPATESIPQPYLLPQFTISAQSQKETLAALNIEWTGRPVLAICAGAEFGSSKRWPAAYYAEVANDTLAQGWDVWLFGSPKDRPITDHIMSLTNNHCINIAGLAVLAQTIDLLSLVDGVITNDSGLMHVASALTKPLIAIYGSTSPRFTPPLGAKAKILQRKLACQPCFKRECPLLHHQCMRDITAAEVITLVREWRTS